MREFVEIGPEHFGELAALHRAYKAEIGEDAPTQADMASLKAAVAAGRIRFFGCCENGTLAGCCSVSVTYSTFDYAASGVFEDFYILPEYRRLGIARALAAFAYEKSGVNSLTVGSAECDAEMYRAIGFSVPLGKMLAYAPGENG